jgi:hypothetical protein
MAIEPTTRAALRKQLQFCDVSPSNVSPSNESQPKFWFTYAELLAAFGREEIDADHTASLDADRSGRSTAHQIARLDVLRAFCAFARYGIQQSIEDGDVVPVQRFGGTTLDEVRFSGHSMIAFLVQQALEVCDDFGSVPPILPCATVDLSDSLETLNCVAAIEQWTVEKIEASLSVPVENATGPALPGRSSGDLNDPTTGNDSPWHSAGESVPEGFCGPLTGNKDDLAAWILPNSAAQTTRYRQLTQLLVKRRTDFWARSTGRTTHEVYFLDQKRYAEANGQRLKSERLQHA